MEFDHLWCKPVFRSGYRHALLGGDVSHNPYTPDVDECDTTEGENHQNWLEGFCAGCGLNTNFPVDSLF